MHTKLDIYVFIPTVYGSTKFILSIIQYHVHTTFKVFIDYKLKFCLKKKGGGEVKCPFSNIKQKTI
jgi:hypothetical protein